MCCWGVLKWLVILVPITAAFVGCVQVWLNHKSYVFSADELDRIAKDALNRTEVGDHNATFTAIEAELRKRYSGHILPAHRGEWVFINAGGWMGAWYLLHASITEYVIFFGTAVDTSGHSGRYWANITDTVISGEFWQWKEGSTEAELFTRGDLVYHGIGEAAAVQWSRGTWMFEYGRGFIPSTLGFGIFSDNLLSSQDLYVIYRSIRIYAIAVVQELLQGNM